MDNLAQIRFRIGQAIKEARQQKHMTQSQLAEKLDISAKHITAIENGPYIPSLKLLVSATLELNLSLDKNILINQKIKTFMTHLVC